MQQSIYLHILSSFNIILIGLATNGSTYCEHTHCENNNPCRTTISHSKGNNRVLGECVCHGKWAGKRCESQIYVTSGLVTSSSAQIGISVKGPNSNDVKPIQGPFSYTLMYWSNSTDHACALIQDLTSQSHRVDGLEPSTDYTVCVESGVVENCFLTYHNDTALSSNCIFLTTEEFHSSPKTTNAAAIVGSVLIVIVVLVVIFAAVLIRKRHFILIDNILGICNCAKCRICCRKRKSNTSLAATDLIVSPDSPLMETTSKMDFSPPSPGKPKHRLLKQRTRGYAAYTTRNDKKIVLTTVLEYNPEGELLDNDPVSHIT